MSKINKVQVDNIIYDIEDSSIPSWARENEKPIYNYEEIENLPVIPSKTSELENDAYYVSSNKSAYFTSGVRMYNHNTFDDGRQVDLYVKNIQGVGYGGYEADLYLNDRNGTNVRILENGTGTLYYKGKEVADREYVDEKIADIEVDIEDIDLTGYITEEELEEKGYLTEHQDLTDYATKEYVDEKIENIEISGGSGEGGNTIAIDNLPIGTIVNYDGEEIPYGYEEVEDYLPIYSNKEKVVGTWVDGTPIYRSFVSGRFTETYADSYWYTPKINGCKRIVDYGGTIYDSVDDTGNGFNAEYGSRVVLLAGNGNLRIDSTNTYHNNNYFEIWIDYTKKEDSN